MVGRAPGDARAGRGLLAGLDTAGHALASHTLTHPCDLVRLPATRIAVEFDRAHQEIAACACRAIGRYTAWMACLRGCFVHRRREAVAGAKRLGEDMTMRMGYPTRMTDRERMADMASVDRKHADRYATGLALKPDSTTEEMRRTLLSYLDLARDLLSRGAAESTDAVDSGREIAG